MSWNALSDENKFMWLSVRLFWVSAIVLLAYEVYWTLKTKNRTYDLKEILSNFGIIGGYVLIAGLFLKISLLMYEHAYAFRIITLPRTIGFLFLTILAADFIYYFEHRSMHRFKILWAFHLAHHSKVWFNLTAAFRLNGLVPLIGTVFYLPLALFGFPSEFIVFGISFNLMYQFWCHTPSIGKLGRMEGILNTPSSHRVHHGSNEVYLDRNFGGILMIWDRIFGTYVPETEHPVYGITSGFVSYNPIVLVFHGFYDLVKGKMNYRG